MKKILLSVITLLLLPAISFAKSDKRGVSENSFQFLAQMEVLEPGVTWFYNWSNSLGNNIKGQEYLEFDPMCWNANYNADNIREYVKAHPQTKFLLGFNEPNFTNQANMTPQAAAAAWPGVQALAKELNLQLVAPAMNYAPNGNYMDPTKWFDEFVALVGTDAFDYTAIHSYGGLGNIQELATKFHDKYGKPIWVTEFCYWPGESGSVAVASQISSMMQSVEWMEKTDWIYRYAWFKALEENAANFKLVESGKSENPRELTEAGKVYVYMSDFNPEIYHGVGETVPASEYISQDKAMLGGSKDSEAVVPIEISQFNAGATLDYQFNVPSAGNYVLNLRVSGQGEPTRFDPNIGVVAVNTDGSDGDVLCENKQFTLSGDDAKYEVVSFPMKLSAGKQTIRLKDFAPYSPSGIRISTITLESTGDNGNTGSDDNTGNTGDNTENPEDTGVDTIEASTYGPVNVYNLQGVCVLKNVEPSSVSGNLPKGLYIIGGKKVVIR